MNLIKSLVAGDNVSIFLQKYPYLAYKGSVVPQIRSWSSTSSIKRD